MTARRVRRALAVGFVIGLVIDVAAFWLAAEFDANLLSF